jgi:hypothetical protein
MRQGELQILAEGQRALFLSVALGDHWFTNPATLIPLSCSCADSYAFQHSAKREPWPTVQVR